MDKKSIKILFKFFLAGLIVIATVFALERAMLLDKFSPQHVKDYILSFGKTSAVIYVLLYILNTIILFPPIGLLSLSAGLIFGRFWGVILLMIASSIGTSCTFFISRLLFQKQIESAMGDRFINLREKLSQKGFYVILFLRIIPVVPYEALNYISGISKIKFKDYFWATFLGLMPGIFIAVFFADSLATMRNIKDFISVKFLIIFLLFIIAAILPAAYKHFKKKEI